MNSSNFDVLSTKASTAAIEKYGTRQEVDGELDRSETYRGPNIRAFMAQNNLSPNDWSKLLDYNQIGSVLGLIEGETILAIPISMVR